jgi:fucose 4-O-acetylase-like acetyltransferase
MGGARDQFLDIAKGIAIMLVILGHVLQGMRHDFDNWLAFKSVYSFHMPLFIFLSGAVTSLVPFQSVATDQRAGTFWLTFLRAVQRSAPRLLLPFMSWTIIGWYVNQREIVSLTDWLVKVYRSPDNSLWFLLLAFECLVLWRAWTCLRDALRATIGPKLKRLAPVFDNDALCAILFWLVMKLMVLRMLAGTPGIAFVGQYLIYFVSGLLFWKYGRGRLRGLSRLVPYAVFVALVPFWHRTEPLMLPDIGPRADGLFRYAVALAGILVVLDVAAIIQRNGFHFIGQALAYCGVASLGIYAIHYYFLGTWPPFFAAMAGSLLTYAVLVRIPVVSLVLLGETIGATKRHMSPAPSLANQPSVSRR